MEPSEEAVRVHLAGTQGDTSGGNRPGGHIPPETDLVHSEAKKRAAAHHISQTLGPATSRAGNKADESNETAVGNPSSPTTYSGKLQGWEVYAGMRHRMNKWNDHHKNLMNRLKAERETLLDTNKLFGQQDIRTSQGFDSLHPKPTPKSKLDDF